MSHAQLRLILTANTQASAQKILLRFQKLVEIQIIELSSYYKGGFEVNATLKIHASEWPHMVLELLQYAQSFGSGWGINECVELSCSRFSVAGVEYAGLHLVR
ncbi:MAG: hypothetical protein COA52_10390 [Hyphomicrobiales bacterium]|nr:hypothetical protein [Hyphomicrobiales bacterium]PCJ90321.1 MAG: hypothetical protein COA52_10390 [Hyphomicrobiales bacterium]